MKAIMVVLLLTSTLSPALAQDGSTSTANGTAQAANNVTVVADAGRYAPADTSVRYSGHTYTTPNVQGSYFAGANGCLVGKGGGVAGGPIGLSFSSGTNDEGCDRRNDAAAWYTLGFKNVAVARLCEGTKNADAFFSATGYACPGTNGKGRYKLADGTNAPEMVLRNDLASGKP